MAKVVLIIPGFLESPKRKIYRQIADCYDAKSFETVVLDMPWKRQLMSDYVNYFFQIYSKYKNNEIYTLGFSFGAMTAFISSSKVKIKAQILCSVSPYFKEDKAKILKSWAQSVGRKRMNDFKSISRKDICQKVKAKTILLVGTRERKVMVGVSESIYKDLNADKDLIEIKGVGHDITAPKYFEEIKKQIKSL